MTRSAGRCRKAKSLMEFPSLRDNARQNISQLLALAITLKCGWLGTPLNANRVQGGAPSAELAAGIHIGSVWAKFTGGTYKRRGFAINVAKRIESASREGQHFRI